MAEVKMDLTELDAIKAEIKQAKEETERVKKELNEQISKLQNEKTELISNQRRVMFTKKSFIVKQYLPYTENHVRELISNSVYDALRKYGDMRFMPDNTDKHEICNAIFSNMRREIAFDREQNTTIPLDKENYYEFINLDDAVQMALEQKGSIYGEKLTTLEKENTELNLTIERFNTKKEAEIADIVKEKDYAYKDLKERTENKLKKLTEESNKKYKELEEEANKKYKELEEKSAKKYKKLEEEFAKYKDDEEKMNMNDKLEKYQKENGDLKKKIEDLEKKLNSKSLFSKIFG